MKTARIIYTLLLVCVLGILYSNAQRRRTPVYDWDAKLEKMGFVDVCYWKPEIQSYLVYRTSNNFLGEPLYNRKLTKAWLHPKAAVKLFKAQELLQHERPELFFLILDAARPLEVQQKMSEWAKKNENSYYVADPDKGGGMHNYGMAVDITLIDSEGEQLSMGSSFDHFGPESHTDREDELLKSHKITQAEYNNRRLLRHIMEEAGFKPVASEWWHFNACTREEALKNFTPIEK